MPPQSQVTLAAFLLALFAALAHAGPRKDDEAAYRFFADVPKAEVKQTEPLAVANTGWRRLFGPATRGKGDSYYIFDTQNLTEIDLTTGKVHTFRMPHQRESRQIYEQGTCFARLAPDRRIYFCLHGAPAWWGRFDPKKRKFQALGELQGFVPSKWIWAGDGYAYVTTHPAMLGRIDIEKGKCEHLGHLGLSDSEVVHGKVGLDGDGWFYCQVGYVQRNVAFNIHTRIQKLLPEPWKPKEGGEKKARSVGKRFVAPNYGKLYEIEGDKLAGAKKEPGDGKVEVRFRRKGEKEWRSVRIQVATVERDLETLGLGPDGKIYGCASYLCFRHDPRTGESEPFTFSYNVYDYCPVGPILYLQGYPNCRLAALDTCKPLTTRVLWQVKSPEKGNPWQIENYSDVRPQKGPKEPLWLKRGRRVVRGFDGRVFTAGTGERYLSGGAIAWTDPQTGVTGCFREAFEFLPVTDLNPINGGRQLAGCTWVMRHSGKPKPQPRDATVFLYDTETNKLVFHVPVPGCNAIQDLAVASPKKWIGLGMRETRSWDGEPALKKSVLFFFDPVGKKVTTQFDLPFSLSRRTGSALIQGPDGLYWAAARVGGTNITRWITENRDYDFGGVVRIDPDQETIEPLFRVSHAGNFVFINKTMYLCGAPGLRVIDIEPYLQ